MGKPPIDNRPAPLSELALTKTKLIAVQATRTARAKAAQQAAMQPPVTLPTISLGRALVQVDQDGLPAKQEPKPLIDLSKALAPPPVDVPKPLIPAGGGGILTPIRPPVVPMQEFEVAQLEVKPQGNFPLWMLVVGAGAAYLLLKK